MKGLDIILENLGGGVYDVNRVCCCAFNFDRLDHGAVGSSRNVLHRWNSTTFARPIFADSGISKRDNVANRTGHSSAADFRAFMGTRFSSLREDVFALILLWNEMPHAPGVGH
jgi:hypothetical protein